MSSKKKRKSVERNKNDKVAKTEIMQVKQPFSKGSQNANTNKNTQIVQVIFPEDVELRKVKKKRKGKSSATKKKEKEKEELLNQLKSKLEEYDNLQQKAQELKIKIPESIGIKVINQQDLKNNETIANYINDVVNKISQLRELIEQAQTPSVGLPMRLGAGIQQFPSLPPAISTIPTPIPTGIPERIPIPNRIPRVEPRTQGDELTPPAPKDETKEKLDKIAEDIKKKLNEKGTQFDEPETETESKSTNTETDTIKEGELIFKQVKLGDDFVGVLAPPGWGLLYNSYRRYLENVEYLTGQNELMEGIYHIPLEKTDQLLNTRDKLRQDYSMWYNNLDPKFKKYILDPKNKILNQVHLDMAKQLRLRPADLAKELFKEQKIPFKEITQGNEKPAITERIEEGGTSPFKDEKENKDYQKYMKEYADRTADLMKIREKIMNMKNPRLTQAEYNDLNSQINNLSTQIENVYNSLSGEVKLGVITENQEIMNRFNAIRTLLNVPDRRPAQPAEPVEPVEPSRISVEVAVKNLNAYAQKVKSNKNPQLTQKIKDSIRETMGQPYLDKLLQETDKKKQRENLTRDFLQWKNTDAMPMTDAARARERADTSSSDEIPGIVF